MSAQNFSRFLELPQELQDLIWHRATEDAKRYRTYFINLGVFSRPCQHFDIAKYHLFPVASQGGQMRYPRPYSIWDFFQCSRALLRLESHYSRELDPLRLWSSRAMKL